MTTDSIVRATTEAQHLSFGNIGDIVEFTFRDEYHILTTVIGEIRTLYANADFVGLGICPHDKDIYDMKEFPELPPETTITLLDWEACT